MIFFVWSSSYFLVNGTLFLFPMTHGLIQVHCRAHTMALSLSLSLSINNLSSEIKKKKTKKKSQKYYKHMGNCSKRIRWCTRCILRYPVVTNKSHIPEQFTVVMWYIKSTWNTLMYCVAAIMTMPTRAHLDNVYAYRSSITPCNAIYCRDEAR